MKSNTHLIQDNLNGVTLGYDKGLVIDIYKHSHYHLQNMSRFNRVESVNTLLEKNHEPKLKTFNRFSLQEIN